MSEGPSKEVAAFVPDIRLEPLYRDLMLDCRLFLLGFRFGVALSIRLGIRLPVRRGRCIKLFENLLGHIVLVIGEEDDGGFVAALGGSVAGKEKSL